MENVNENDAVGSKKRQRIELLIKKSNGLAQHHQHEYHDTGSKRINHRRVKNGNSESAMAMRARDTPSEPANIGDQGVLDHHAHQDSARGTQYVRKQTWTTQEDSLLRELVQRHGYDWAVIAALLPGRDRKRCRERFVNHVDPRLTGHDWNNDEDERMMTLYRTIGAQWASIATHLSGRSPDDVKNRCFQLLERDGKQYDRESKSASTSQDRWTTVESEQLRALVAMHGAHDWFFLASQLRGGRTDLQCRQHWHRVLLPSIRKGKGSWRVEDDNLLREKVAECGPRWTEIAQSFPGRLGKQCRDRYVNHVDPSIKTTPWTLDEENILTKEQHLHGCHWAQIAKQIPGRPENAIKNHWHTMQRRKKLHPTERENPRVPCASNTTTEPAVSKKIQHDTADVVRC